MTESSTPATPAEPPETAAAPAAETPSANASASGLALIIGIAAAAIAVTLLIFRVVLRSRPAADETAERVQSLIDEANRLIRALEDKK